MLPLLDGGFECGVLPDAFEHGGEACVGLVVQVLALLVEEPAQGGVEGGEDGRGEGREEEAVVVAGEGGGRRVQGVVELGEVLVVRRAHGVGCVVRGQVQRQRVSHAHPSVRCTRGE